MEEWETLSVEQRAAIDAPDPRGAWGDWVAMAQTGRTTVTIGRGFRAREARVVRAHGHHYLANPKVDRSRNSGSMLGFGGRDWTIRFIDGEVIETNDLWHQGEIPLALRRELPDNAEFIGDTRGFDSAPVVKPVDSVMDGEMKKLSRFQHNYRKVLKFITNLPDVDDYAFEEEERRPEVPIQDAHVVGSRITEGPRAGLHTLIVDIDHPVRAPQSTSFDHHHLYVDYPMPWEDVVKVLRVLAEVGIVEPGYAAASIDRGETNVRLPWVLKHHDYEQINYVVKNGERWRQGSVPNDGDDEEAPF